MSRRVMYSRVALVVIAVLIVLIVIGAAMVYSTLEPQAESLRLLPFLAA